ncbi:MAG: Crp/Fnr family transcriptional regulator [Gammaproteobacteria bacterium]|nr:Crp/Fnr family transcriptional regulator [Gammaproteobacteria bacterium]
MVPTLRPEPQQNRFLAALPPEVQDRLFQHLELVPMPLHAVLYEPDHAMRHVYFPTDSIVSLQYLLEGGGRTALSVVGNEGLVGVNLFIGGATAPSRSLVQRGGHAYRVVCSRVIEEFGRGGRLFVLMLRYTNALITQISHTAVCNRQHTIDQQICRWLLISLDRLPDTHLPMTQKFISNMFGVRPARVSEVVRVLQRLGAISYSRGLIKVLDRSRLEDLSCDCYTAVRKETDLLLDYIS